MRTWFWTVLLVSLAVLVAFAIHRFPGNVLIVVDQWRVQVSLAFAILLAIVGFASLYALIRVLTWLADMPQRYRGWKGQRQEKREQSQLEQGWTALLEGRYTHAEKTLTRLSGKSADKRRQVLAMLSAARAAHEVGEVKRQDELLAQAQAAAASQSGDVDLNTAVAAAAADLWLQQERAQEALAALQVDHVQPMRHLHTMRLMLRVYQQTNNHSKVLELARALKRKDAISQTEANKLIESAAACLIKASITDKATWQACWKSLKSEEKLLPEVALAGSQAFQMAGEYKEATKVLEAAIVSAQSGTSASKSSSTDGLFDPRLLAAYARAEPEQVTPRLQKAELWLQERKTQDNKGKEKTVQEKKSDGQDSSQNDPSGSATDTVSDAALLTTLGSLCLAAQMWGQAQRYLEQSAKLRPDARVHALLGSLFDRIGQPQRAAQHWRLATAVSAALPTLVQDVVLPAANTEADPVIPHSEGLGVFDDDNAQASDADAAKIALATTENPASTYDEFFDSAPIPMGHFESIDEQAPPKGNREADTQRDGKG